MSPVNPVTMGDIAIGGGSPLVLIAGPVRHRERGTRRRAGRRACGDIARRAAACRSSSRRRSTRPTARPADRSAGPASTRACASSPRIKARYGVPILTDIHEPAQARAGRRGRRRPADSGVPLAARPTCSSPPRGPGRVVNIKKGQFLAPDDMRHAVAKVVDAGNPRVLVTERGTSFGYHNLVVDMRAFPMMRAAGRPGRLRRDAQPAAARRRRRRHRRPGASTSSRSPRPASRPASTACSSRCTTIRPRAKSDAQNALRLDRLEPLLRRLMAIDAHRRSERRRRRTPSMADLALARKVLETEAAAILALVARLDERFDARGRAAPPVPRPRHPHRHGQVGHHLPEDRRDARRAPARRRSSCTRPRPFTATSASSRPTTSSSRCRTAARPTRSCGCSRRSAASARG